MAAVATDLLVVDELEGTARAKLVGRGEVGESFLDTISDRFRNTILRHLMLKRIFEGEYAHDGAYVVSNRLLGRKNDATAKSLFLNLYPIVDVVLKSAQLASLGVFVECDLPAASDCRGMGRVSKQFGPLVGLALAQARGLQVLPDRGSPIHRGPDNHRIWCGAG